MSEFYSILTAYGLEQIAAATTKTIQLSQMAFSNSTTAITGDETTLAGEVCRVTLTKVSIDSAAPNTIITEAIITGNLGGFWIRKVGIFDNTGKLFAIGRFPATYKPVVAEGSVKELAARMVLRVSNAPEIVVSFNNGIIDGAANTDLDNLTIAGQRKFDDKANIESPDFTGTPTAPTPEDSANDTKLATTAFVKAAISALVDSAPEALDTLQELAAALGNDADFATTITNILSDKAARNGDTIAVASANPTSGFIVRNIKAQTEDPGTDSELSTGDILLIYEE